MLNWWSFLKVEAGQFYAPFTIENMTSENYSDFMERSSAVRFAVPNTREVGGMLFGELPRKAARYWVGVFNGDGQNNKNLDNRPAVIGRAYFAPLALLPHPARWLEEIWVGGSFWWQQSTNVGGGSAPSTTGVAAGDLGGVTTQGGFALFSSNYGNGTDLLKNPIRTHLAPDGTTLKYAFEANLPLPRRLGLRAEYTHQSIDFRQYQDTTLGRTAGAAGNLTGYSAYVEAYAWIGGDVGEDHPGLYHPPHWSGYQPSRKPTWALQLAVKYEHVDLDITGLPGTTNAGGTTVADPAAGHYSLDVFEAGASLYFTRHTRLIANYVINYIGRQDDSSGAGLERKNLFWLRAEHELLFRLAVAL